MNNINTLKRSKTKMIIIIIVALIGALLIFAATKPDNFRIERSITINATPDRVFELVNDFHAWNLWSPWEKKDPDMKRTYSGSATGIGAIYAWEGNNSVGTGEMEITTSVPFSHIQIALRFMKPFKANNTADFIFTPNSDATRREFHGLCMVKILI